MRSDASRAATRVPCALSRAACAKHAIVPSLCSRPSTDCVICDRARTPIIRFLDGSLLTLLIGADDKDERSGDAAAPRGRPLQKIGRARVGGAQHHGDWSSRNMHKKCFKESRRGKPWRKHSKPRWR